MKIYFDQQEWLAFKKYWWDRPIIGDSTPIITYLAYVYILIFRLVMLTACFIGCWKTKNEG